MGKFELLTEFRRKIPFLNLIPNKIYFNLDPSEFYLPDSNINIVRSKLEKELGHYVMTYKTTLNTRILLEKHLCANVKVAKLTEKQIKILQDYEKKYKNKDISFGVYNKPLKLINPKKSDIYKLYVKLGLRVS